MLAFLNQVQNLMLESLVADCQLYDPNNLVEVFFKKIFCSLFFVFFVGL